MVLVVVNSTVYGGSGGSIGTYSLASGATEIALHEMGHTAYGLADEYQYYAGGNETGHDHHPAGEPTEPNVTTNTDRNTLKWRWAVASTTAIPTMSNPNCAQVDNRASTVPAGTVGVFEGAHYYHCGAYRPEYDCKMRELGVPFCRVCRQVIWNRIGPLATLPARARTPINVVARFPEHLDVFAVGRERSHHEQLVGPEQRLGGLVPGVGRDRVRRWMPGRPSPRSTGTPGISTCSRSAPTTGSTAAGGTRAPGGRAGSRSATCNAVRGRPSTW